MEISTLIIGLIIGLIAGFGGAWMWATASLKAKYESSNTTETQLKALLAAQANDYLLNSSQSFDRISDELSTLKTNMMNYEQALSAPLEDDSRSTYFGEHASLFLRNTSLKAPKSANDKNTSDQPRDFSNKASGLFVGHPDVENLPLQEKSNN
jgi:uncharacterized membrane-anchored protein YhcB (DUF1043 family)